MKELSETATFGTRRQLTLSLEQLILVTLGYQWAEEVSGSRIWAYRSFDCALRANGNREEAAVFAANGLNAGISSTTILQLLNAFESGELPELRGIEPFWTLDPESLQNDPLDDGNESSIWRWYNSMTSIDDVGPAVSSKVGHHINADAMPLWDSQIGKFWTSNAMWPEFNRNLRGYEDFLMEAERLVEKFRTEHMSSQGVQINRMRIIDIAMWLEARGQFQFAFKHGSALIQDLVPMSEW